MNSEFQTLEKELVKKANLILQKNGKIFILISSCICNYAEKNKKEVNFMIIYIENESNLLGDELKACCCDETGLHYYRAKNIPGSFVNVIIDGKDLYFNPYIQYKISRSLMWNAYQLHAEGHILFYVKENEMIKLFNKLMEARLCNQN